MAWWRVTRPGSRRWWLPLVLAAIFLAAHLPFLASTLEDIDSINFALGVRDFDPGRHRPHPPGYPVYIALAKVARLVLSEPHALAFWGALFAALAAFPLLRLFQGLDALDAGGHAPPGPPETRAWLTPAVLATIVTMASPLYWMTAVRPMSDSAGLAAVTLALSLLVTAWVRQCADRPDDRGRLDAATAVRSGRLILGGALVAALAVGVRSQAVWLTVPALLAVLLARRGRGAAGAAIGASVWFVVGALAWFVPLVIASGGPSAYLAALNSQATEDWTGVDLLATNPSLRRLAFGLYDTLIPHWAGLGWVVVALAAAGAVAILWRQRRASVFLIAAFAPYALFHLLFQESVTTRYALPLVPPVVYMAIRGLWLLGRTPAAVTAAAFVAISLAQVVPVTVMYSSAGSPVARALDDLHAEVSRVGHAVLGRHFRFARAIEAGLDPQGITVLEGPPRFAWLDISRHLVEDGRAPLWFFASPRRTDLALLDPASRVLKRSYRWPFASATFLGGVRPNDVDWIEVRQPGWVATEGWHLTPETAGLAVASGKGLGAGPIAAHVRARPGAAVVMVGGRHFGPAGDTPIRFTMRVGAQDLATWMVPAGPTFFLRFVPVPAGMLASPTEWLALTIEGRRADNGRYAAQCAVEQFDVQDDGVVVAGYDTGWHERELDPATGTLWRWTSQRAELRIHSAGRDVLLRVTGESPTRYFVRPSRVTVRAGDRVLLATSVAADFAWAIDIPAAALEASGGTVTIETDQTFRPADRGENQDRRSLGLRVYDVTVRPAS